MKSAIFGRNRSRPSARAAKEPRSIALLGAIAGFLYRRADRIVVVSPAFKHHLIRYLSVPANARSPLFEAACTRAAKFINAKIVRRKSSSRAARRKASISSPVRGERKNLKPGDVILLTEMEHHSNLVPWQLLAQRTGEKIAYVPVTGDEGILDLSNSIRR